MESHEIKLLGREFRIRSADPESHVAALVAYVNDKLEAAMGEHKHVPLQNALVLVSLNMADEILKERERTARMAEKLRVNSRELLERLGA